MKGGEKESGQNERTAMVLFVRVLGEWWPLSKFRPRQANVAPAYVGCLYARVDNTATEAELRKFPWI